tara:strand:+ start:235 stop:606 length:372 start_codon:yes stop_codon:yes gene_type:complete
MSDNFTSEIDIEMQSLNPFEYSKFRQFLIENKVTVTVVGFVIGNNILRLIDSFFDDIILVCNTDKNKNEDIQCETIVDFIYYYKITINKYNIHIGRFIFAIIRFIISGLIAFYIARLFRDVIN